MALAHLTPRDYYRLGVAVREARTRDIELVPSLEELLPEVRAAVERDGDLVDNLAHVFGEPIRRGFDLVKVVLAEKHGDLYAVDLWSRFIRKGD